MRVILRALSAVLAAPAAPQVAPDPRDDVVVTGMRDVVVNGRAIRCRRLPNDPQDLVDAGPRNGDERPLQSEIARLPNGRFVYEQPDAEHLTGPDTWARAGRRMDQYIFRTPTDGRPLCIGGVSPDPGTFGQLRKELDAAPYWGKRLRFTVWIATGNARRVNFWLAAGQKMKVTRNGGNTNNHPFGGNHSWTPVALETGPIARKADHISYGFLLYGAGAIWAYKPQLEVVTDTAGLARKGNVLMIGASGREPAGPPPDDDAKSG